MSKNQKNNKTCRKILPFSDKWEMPKKEKIRQFKSYHLPKLMYGAEIWTWTKADITREAEIRFLRSTEREKPKRTE
jgi:hypothetical protein